MIATYVKVMRTALLPVMFCSLLAGSTAPVTAQTPGTCSLTVRVTRIRNASGNLRMTLRRSEDSIVESRLIEIDAKTLTAETVFDKLPPGNYGVAVIHDENKNGKLDMNEMGMPVEGYGHSNNPERRPGPPKFDETKFTLT
jgi:uncharacterized protein (DUF2141 family)